MNAIALELGLWDLLVSLFGGSKVPDPPPPPPPPVADSTAADEAAGRERSLLRQRRGRNASVLSRSGYGEDGTLGGGGALLGGGARG